jgi:hypothetical protein
MFIGWPTNIRRHSRHVGQPAYVHWLMCRSDEHKRVYPVPPFLSLTSLSHISSTHCIATRATAATNCSSRCRHIRPRAGGARPQPPWSVPPWPRLTLDPPRTALTTLDPLRPARRLPGRARPRPAPASTSPVGPAPPGPTPQLGSLC